MFPLWSHSNLRTCDVVLFLTWSDFGNGVPLPIIYTHHIMAEGNDCNEIRARLGISRRRRLDFVTRDDEWAVKEVRFVFTELSQG